MGLPTLQFGSIRSMLYTVHRCPVYSSLEYDYKVVTVCVCHHRPELSAVIGLKGCVKGFQFQKKDFNLLEEPGTIGISSGCPEEAFVSAPSTTFQALTVSDNALRMSLWNHF